MGPYADKEECYRTWGFYARKDDVKAVSQLNYFHVKTDPNAPKPKAPEKTLGDITVVVISEGGGKYLLDIRDKGNSIYQFSTKSIAEDAGNLSKGNVTLHRTNDGTEYFIGVTGIGRNRDIVYYAHLSKVSRGGTAGWKVDSDFGEGLGHYGCGQAGLKTSLSFNNRIGTLKFWVGSKSPCELTIKIENGKLLVK